MQVAYDYDYQEKKNSVVCWGEKQPRTLHECKII